MLDTRDRTASQWACLHGHIARTRRPRRIARVPWKKLGLGLLLGLLALAALGHA